MSRAQYLVEVVAYDASLPGTRTLRYCSGVGFVTGPAETPANTEYAPRLVEPGDISRSIVEVAVRGVRPQVTVGDVLLLNGDGALDGLADYGFDGRAITIRLGTEGAAYPAGFPVIYTGTMEDAEVTRAHVRIRLRDNTTLLSVPLQTTKYAGDNVLPDGLEGVEGDLKGKPKPLVFGTVTNIAPPCVNTAKLIYQVNDGAVDSVDGVYDSGLSLGQSPNGWTRISHGEGAFSGRGAAASPTALLLSGIGGSSDAKVIRTSDGSTFDDVTGSIAGAQAEDIAYGAGVHVVVTWDSPDGHIYTSPDDGDNWTERSLPASWVNTVLTPLSVRWHEVQEVFVITAENGAIATSPTGETWTARTSGVSVDLWDSASDGDRIGVCGGDSGGGSGGIVLESLDDGATWEDFSIGLTTADPRVLTIGNARGAWVIGTDGGKLLTSVDFRTWTLQPSPINAGAGIFTTLHSAGWWVTGAAGNIAYSGEGEQWKGSTFLGGLFADHAGTFALAAYGGRLWGTGTDTFGSGDHGVWAAEAPIEYADLTELVDDDEAPEPGSYGWVSHADGSYIRLGSPPAGLVTADVTQGATAADRTAGSLFENVLTKAGYTSADWSTADVTALDSAENAVQGLYVGEGETPTVEEVIDRIAHSVGAWWSTDGDGLFRIAQWTAPSGSAVLTLTDNDVIDLQRLPSDRPSYSTVVRYARNHVVQDSDLAFGVSDARRAALAKEYREATSTDAAVQTAHPLAAQVTKDTLYAVAADAAAEAARLQTLFGSKRSRYTLTCHLTAETEALELGDCITVTSSRFGLSAGALVRILALQPRRKDRRLSLTVWK